MVDVNDVLGTNPQNASEEPLYNIGVITRMTGISKATLRAWERRYGFPESDRTSGGHRLYSERDIIRLRWVKNRIDQGMQTAQAIRALKHQETKGGFESGPEKHKPIDFDDIAAPVEFTESISPLMTVYQRRLFQSFMNKDTQAADQLIGEALVSSPPETLILDVIAPTLVHIGHAWENDKIDVAVEHLATNYLRNRLMMWMLSGPPARTISPIVLACAPGEWHEMSLLIMGTLLRRRRWPIAYLGQSLPIKDLSAFVRDIQPDLVVVVAMSEGTAISLLEWPQYLPTAAQTGRPIITYGGRAFVRMPDLRLKMPGLYLGDTIQEGLTTIETLLMGQ